MGKLWTSPNTLLGLLLAIPSGALGARFAFGHNALQVLGCPVGRGALTLGNVILYAQCAPADCGHWYGCDDALPLGKHEEAHTHQYQRLGPLFLPLYWALGGISAKNPLERAANAYAAGGSWWPQSWARA